LNFDAVFFLKITADNLIVLENLSYCRAHLLFIRCWNIVRYLSAHWSLCLCARALYLTMCCVIAGNEWSSVYKVASVLMIALRDVAWVLVAGSYHETEWSVDAGVTPTIQYHRFVHYRSHS